jgi:hypothetical protein
MYAAFRSSIPIRVRPSAREAPRDGAAAWRELHPVSLDTHLSEERLER